MTHHIFPSCDVRFDEEDFSLNFQLSKDSTCNGNTEFGKASVSPKSTVFGLPIIIPDEITPNYDMQRDSEVSAPTTRVVDLPDSNPCPVIDTQIQVSTESSSVTSTRDDSFNDFSPDTTTTTLSSPPTRPVNRAQHRIIKPNRKYALVVAGFDVIVPYSYKKALASPEWKFEMENEIKALHHNATWSLVPRQSDDNVISTKWVFKAKQNKDGFIEWLKARLVANGMHQVQGLDYLDTFSPIVHPLSIRLILTLIVTNGWAIHQIDISNVFLHGNLQERIIVSQPPGFQDPSKLDHVCLLHKSLYGLKQSARCWFQKLREVLHTLGLVESQTDP